MTRKLSVLSRVSSLAVAAVLTAGAAAQSFQGTPTVASGDVFITEGSGITNVNVNSVQSVIDWVPDDNAVGNFGGINFQPSGTTATFSSFQDFAVLNRINVADPGRVVGLNGAINSLVNGNTGGSVYFYSPSGFVVGSSAVINVGNLVLTASPLAIDGNGNFLQGTTATFTQAPNPNAAVTTVAGSQINALNQGSYVALVAPRVEHHGTIHVNGAAVLVGAEAATINFRAGGLFDIQVDIGTTDANGVDVDGTITGPASTGFGDNHRAYLVAVPKNTALTLLIGSGADLGFDIAGAADVVGNAVVLSAGHDISFGGTVDGPSVGSGADANISIGNANFTSALYGRADGDVAARAVDGSMTFASDASLRGRDKVTLEAWGGGNVSVDGNLYLSANASGSTEGASAAAGNVTLQALGGGTLSVTGNTDLSAIGTGGFSSTEGLASGDGTGGTILVQATTGGDMTLGGSLNADATGRGGGIGNINVDGGDGFGGTVNLFTSGGSSMSVAGSTSLRADGRAGSTLECFTCGGVGGIGDGGTVNVQAHSGPDNSMAFGDVLYIYADGQGGTARTGDGGAGLGGNINFSAADSSSVTVASDVSLQAEGYGGSALAGVGDGGLGQGGNIQAFAAENGTLSLTAGLQEYVGGYGGSAEGGSGGLGQGGLGQLFTVGSTATVGGYASIFAAGRGGDGLVQGGAGRGGTAYFSSADGGSLSITGFASLSADGRGGRGYGADGAGGDGGDGYGGHVEAFANNGASLTFGSDLYLDADGEGGSSGDSGTSAGDGFGGDVYLQAVGGGAVDVIQELYANAAGLGGSGNFGVYSGNGTGGTITVISRDGTSTLTVAGGANLEADGYAGYSSECSSQCSAGGIGQGGDIFIASTGVLTGSTLDFQSTLFASANGHGGESAIIDFDTNTTVDGGEGRGGTVSLYANGGNSLNVEAELTLEAIGYGGDDPVDLAGGDGTGGIVRLNTDSAAGNLITLGSSVVLDASGYGGDSGRSANGDGGDGVGGTARVAIAGGLLDISGDLALYSIGYGGNTFGGTGGDGTGNIAQIDALGGVIDIGGNAYADASGFGGDGMVGGDGLGGGNIVALTGGARILAFNSDITVGGSAIILSEGTGGDGSFGGGAGGDGTGGLASIFAGNNNLGPSSITIQGVESSALVSASGFGGNGGDGVSGLDGVSGGTGTDGGAGSAGGNGGTGTGGRAAVSAAAGNGTLNIGLVVAEATGSGGAGGIGGNGGFGGNGDGGPAGNGGAGGAGGAGGEAVGGLVTVGVASGDAQAAGVNLGTANFGSVLLDASAQGGAGGAGGTGGAGGFGPPDGIAGADGNGGDGGFATGGTANLIVLGGTVNLFSADLVANATGGDGGNGTIAGAGGDAESDEVGVIVTQRGSDTSLRGTLDAEIITGTVNSTGGSGSIFGVGLMEGGSSFIVENGDVTLGSLDFTITADGQIADLATDSIAVVNGTVTVDGAFNFTTAGVASVYAEVGDPATGTLNAQAFNVSADNFIHDPERPLPSAIGTISADTFDLSTNGDLIIDAHLVSTASLNLSAPGLIDIEDATSGSDLTLDAGSSISGGSMTAAGLVDASAHGDIGLNLAIAGTTVTMQSIVGSIFVNEVSAGGLADLHANIDVSTGDITSGDSINIVADTGGISVGDLIAQTSVDLNAQGAIGISGIVDAGTDISMTGATISAGDMSAGGFIALTADTIFAGNLTAGGFIDLFAGGPATITVGNLSGAGVYATSIGDITTGTIDSTLDVDLLSFNGSITTLDVTAATDITADAAGLLTMGNLIGQTVDLSAGTSIVAGNVNATELLATTLNGDMSFGDIATLLGLSLNAQGSILTGLITTGDFVTLQAGGTIGTGDINATTDVTLNATGAVTTGDITAGGLIDATGASLTLGNLNANSIDLTTTVADLTVGNVTIPGNLALTTAGDLVFGNLNAFDVDLAATLSMTGGNINSTTDITAIAGTSMSLGDLVAGGTVSATSGSLAIGNVSGSVLNLTSNVGDVSTGDLIAFSSLTVDSAADFLFGSIVAPLVDLVAPGSIIGGAITSDSDISAVAGADIDVGDLSAGGFNGDVFQFGDISLTAGGDISTGLVFAAGSVTADATGSVTTLNIDAFDAVGLTAGTFIAAGDVNANSVDMLAGTNIGIGDITAFANVTLDAGGSLAFGNISAFVVVLSADGAIDGGNIDSETDITAIAGGDIDLLDLTAGGTTSEGFFDGSVALTAGDLVNTGAIDAFGSVGISAGGGITTGAIDAGTFVELGALGDIATDDIDAGDFIDASAGGTATLNGIWSAQDVTLASNDIDIGGTGGISGSGLVTLISTNATQALIGDGLTGNGYALSNAEFGRIEGGSVHILARGDASAAQDMLIGDLTVTGPTAGSTIEDGDGILVFATGDLATQTSGGVIRVVGDVAATGFGAGNAMEFHAGTFELDAATGSISITSSGTTLGGELGLYADQIHVASGTILDQLAIDPQYAGYQDDLNAPAAVQRPEGVLNAGVIWIESDNLQNILIQNTGTVNLPAGFLANEIFVNEDFEIAGPPGSIDVIVNGQLITAGGTLTGVAVRDALVEGEDLTPFTANSTINGCLLSGPCGVIEPPEPPFPPGFTPTPGIQDEVRLVQQDLLPPPMFDNETFIDDNNALTQEGETSPIEPPQPLFDTSGLGDDGDVDDPVSGSGNPALMEVGGQNRPGDGSLPPAPPPTSNQEKQP